MSHGYPVPAECVSSRRFRAVAVSMLAVVLLTVACTPTRGQAARPKTAEFTLVAGLTDTNGTFNFNGYAKGALTVTVPRGWQVVIHYKNKSGLRHSFDVIPYSGTQPDKALPPAFKGASTKDLTDGIGAGHAETVTFVASKAGKFEFLCGVLGHAQAGMWDYLIVSPTAKAPSAEPSAAVDITIK